jgi:hypothetical protein
VRLPAWWRRPAALVVACVTFPAQQLVPAAGVDASWQAGLALAHGHGLHFGSDIVFTYGPLGFLTAPQLFVVWAGVAAVAFSLLLQVLLCGTLLHVTRDLPGPVAVLVTYLVAAAAPPGLQAEVGLMIVLALTLSILADTDTHAPRWLPMAGGCVASTLLLIKPNVGALALVLVLVAIAVASCGQRRIRAFAELAGSFVVVFAVIWLGTGNAVRDVVPWAHASAQFAAGYTAGMALDDPSLHHVLVRAGLLLLVEAVLLWHVVAGGSRARRAWLALAWAIGAFAMFKEGFVRHDGHVTIFAVAVVAASLARGKVTRIGGAGIAVVASVWSFAAFGVQGSALFHSTDRLDGHASELTLLTDGAARSETLARTRAAMLADIGLPPDVLRDLRSHTVDVQPTETSAVWTLGLHWRPEPVFQSYAVLTPALDRLNADFLASRRAPERVLRLRPLSTIDYRYPVFDAPSAFLALVCNYRETFANRGLEVLAHATNRCAPPRRLSTEAIQAGQPLRVPHARQHELVYARLRIPRPFADRLRELVWKPAVHPAIVLDGVSYRLIAATASGPLLMRMPSSAGFSASSVGDTRIQMFRLTHVPSPVQVDFYAVRVG